MIVVSDAGPVHYLILIGAVDVLPRLYSRVVLPEAVLQELLHPNAPAIVKEWITKLPDWADVISVKAMLLPHTGTLGVLDAATPYGLVDLRAALQRLQATNFRISSDLIEQIIADSNSH